MKPLYLVRHCRASGQEPEAALTEEGLAQAERLADFLAPLAPDRILSSPFRRAVQSVEPLAARLDLPIELDVGVTDEGTVALAGAPPTQHVETTYMPVFHRISLSIRADEDLDGDG
jgi:2,3-bisphosphoglycerate-dependent phosphoglycerate mutase